MWVFLSNRLLDRVRFILSTLAPRNGSVTPIIEVRMGGGICDMDSTNGNFETNLKRILDNVTPIVGTFFH